MAADARAFPGAGSEGLTAFFYARFTAALAKLAAFWGALHMRLIVSATLLACLSLAGGQMARATSEPEANDVPATASLVIPPATVTLNSCPSSMVTGLVGDYPGGAAGTMRQFLGIPYAAPPTGANRWQAPKPVTCWSGNRNAKQFGKVCPQSGSPSEGEDCLFLNVFTQSTGAVNGQPVMVFIHGGGFTSGSSSYQLNPANLVAQGVVVVTINYRLGALGFLAHSAIDKVATKNTGNYGILDQQTALQWVKTNIAKFGGNPANVTIFGQSAGGLSVVVHLVSPLSSALFQRAIIESGASYVGTRTVADAEMQGSSFGTAIGCPGSGAATATCLRSKPVATILAKQNLVGQSVRLLRQDGVVIPGPIETLLVQGKFKKAPVIIGSAHDEMRFHIPTNPTLGVGAPCSFVSNLVPDSKVNFAGAVGYSNALANNNTPLSGTVAGSYPAGATGTSANIAFARQGTDANFACRAFRAGKWMTQKAAVVFAYEFNDPAAPPTLFSPFKLHDGTTFAYGAYHGGDLPYLFRMSSMNACGKPIPALTATQKLLSAAMVTYWTSFAKTGNPNPAGSALPKWPQLTANGNMISLHGASGTIIKASAFDADHKCSSFWDGIGQ
jgi:para-nitrobenzyl esterase